MSLPTPTEDLSADVAASVRSHAFPRSARRDSGFFDFAVERPLGLRKLYFPMWLRRLRTTHYGSQRAQRLS